MRLPVITAFVALFLISGFASAATVDFTYEQGENADWQTVSFTGTATGLDANVTVSTWSWDFRDGSTGSGENPSHTFSIEDDDDLTQTVAVNVTLSDGTTAFNEKNIDLEYPSLDAEFTVTPDTGYAPFEVDVSDNTVGPHNPEWDWGDTTPTSSLSQTSHTYETAGTYTLKLTVTRDTESDTMEKTITVKAPDVTAAFSANKTTGIVPMTVNFSDESSGGVSSWSWEIEGLTTRSDQNFAYTFDSAGNYTVKLTVSGSGGEDTEEKTDYIVVKPNITAGFTAKPTSGDNPLTVRFTDTSTGHELYESRYWDFGDGRHSTSINPEHVYTYAGNYTVSLTVTNDQGSVKVEKEDYIVVTHDDATPTATATPTPAVTATPAPAATAAPAEAAVAAANSAAVVSSGTRIFGIPGTEIFRTEIGRLYSFYKEYLYFLAHL